MANIGDMLDRLTAAGTRRPRTRSATASGRDRFSFPFFFDPVFAAEIPPLPSGPRSARRPAALDGQNLHAFTSTYSDYLLGKMSKVFPQLQQEVLTTRPRNAGCSACSSLTTSSASLTCPLMLVIELKTYRTVPLRSIT